MKKTVLFEKERDTKNTVVFTEKPEPGNPPIIGTIYFQKWFVADRAKVMITLEFSETNSGSMQI